MAYLVGEEVKGWSWSVSGNASPERNAGDRQGGLVTFQVKQLRVKRNYSG